MSTIDASFLIFYFIAYQNTTSEHSLFELLLMLLLNGTFQYNTFNRLCFISIFLIIFMIIISDGMYVI